VPELDADGVPWTPAWRVETDQPEVGDFAVNPDQNNCFFPNFYFF
jgi:hypothetical protein